VVEQKLLRVLQLDDTDAGPASQGGARPGGRVDASGLRAFASRWVTIFSVTAEASMHAMIRTAPPHARQVSMSIPKPVPNLRFRSDSRQTSIPIDWPFRVETRHWQWWALTRHPAAHHQGWTAFLCRPCRTRRWRAAPAAYADRTSFSLSKRTGLTRCSSKPASRVRCRSSSWPQPVMAMSRNAESACLARSRRAAS